MSCGLRCAVDTFAVAFRSSVNVNVKLSAAKGTSLARPRFTTVAFVVASARAMAWRVTGAEKTGGFVTAKVPRTLRFVNAHSSSLAPSIQHTIVRTNEVGVLGMKVKLTSLKQVGPLGYVGLVTEVEFHIVQSLALSVPATLMRGKSHTVCWLT